MTVQVSNSSELLDTWASSGPQSAPDSIKVEAGWGVGERPPAEFMNWLQNTFGQKINRALRDGVTEWNAVTSYRAGDAATRNGSIWLALSANAGSQPTVSNNAWTRLLARVDFADTGAAATGTSGTTVMTPQRSTDHFNARTSTLTRALLGRTTEAQIRADLGVLQAGGGNSQARTNAQNDGRFAQLDASNWGGTGLGGLGYGASGNAPSYSNFDFINNVSDYQNRAVSIDGTFFGDSFNTRRRVGWALKSSGLGSSGARWGFIGVVDHSIMPSISAANPVGVVTAWDDNSLPVSNRSKALLEQTDNGGWRGELGVLQAGQADTQARTNQQNDQRYAQSDTSVTFTSVTAQNITATTSLQSDPKLKTNKRHAVVTRGQLDSIALWYFTWKQTKQVLEWNRGKDDLGVMADEIERVFPECVYLNDGVRLVDYAKLGVCLILADMALRREGK